MTETKHSWTEQELWVVCICYKEKLPIELALKLTNTTNAKSMEMRYANCLFLDKGRVDGSLSHASKTLVKVWEEVQKLYEPEEEEFELEEEEIKQVVIKPNQEEPIDVCSVLIVLLTIMFFWSGLVHKNGI